jgi:hypothetical protein
LVGEAVQIGGHKTMSTKIILAVAVLFLLVTVLYQGSIIAQEDVVIREYMSNPCVPLTPVRPLKTGGNLG